LISLVELEGIEPTAS